MEFTKRLDKVLDFYGLTATAFAEEIDFNRSTISHLLSGRNKPSLEFVMALLKKFPEVELQWLINGKGSFPSSEKKETATPPEEIVTIKKEKTDLFSEIPTQEKSSFIQDKNIESESSSPIERVIIFYKDGSFKSYEN